MTAWLGSASFIVLSAMCGCLLGFGLAAVIQGLKAKKARRGKTDKH